MDQDSLRQNGTMVHAVTRYFHAGHHLRFIASPSAFSCFSTHIVVIYRCTIYYNGILEGEVNFWNASLLKFGNCSQRGFTILIVHNFPSENFSLILQWHRYAAVDKIQKKNKIVRKPLPAISNYNTHFILYMYIGGLYNAVDDDDIYTSSYYSYNIYYINIEAACNMPIRRLYCTCTLCRCPGKL